MRLIFLTTHGYRAVTATGNFSWCPYAYPSNNLLSEKLTAYQSNDIYFRIYEFN
jgi:hypothetical protein